MPLVLVYCANGFQGRAIATALLDAGYRVRALVRDEAKAASLERRGAELAAASLDDHAALQRAHEDVDVAVLQLPAGNPAELTRYQSAMALTAIRVTGVSKVVLNTAVQFPRLTPDLPAFAAKQDLERSVLSSGLRVTVIRPSFLLSNLLLPWATHSIAKEGVLRYPIANQQTLSWAAPEDIGRLAAATIGNELYGHTILAGARRAVRGEALAAAFSRALRREIRYEALPLDAFEAGVDAALGPGVGKQVGAMFRFIRSNPEDLDFVTSAFSAPAEFPSFEPMALEDWVTAHRDAFE
jgi:uncharacterized protein YbjT (DUF2867 family)